MAKRRGREFFEVFRPMNRPESGSGRTGQGGGESGGSVPSVSRDSALAPPRTGPQSGKGKGKGGSAPIVLRLSRPTAAGLALAVIALIALSHAWGLSRGRSQTGYSPLPSDAGLPAEDERVEAGQAEEPGQPAEATDTEPARPATPSGRAWVLCIATYRNAQHAQTLREQLRDEFGDQYRGRYEFHYIEVQGDGRTLPAVGVGPLEDHRSSEAQRLRREFREMDFRGQSTPFSGAYFVPVAAE